MPKGLTTDQKNTVGAQEVKTRTLLTIYINNTDNDILRILENDTLEVLEIGDDVFIAGAVKRSDVDTQMEGSIESCNITISNINQDISSIIVNEGDVLTGSVCVIEEAIYLSTDACELVDEQYFTNILAEDGTAILDETDDSIIDDAVEIFRGKINNIHLNAREFTFDVQRNLGGYDYEAPKTSYDASCQWIFKDERCLYSGAETSCDKTMTRCKQLSNVVRFGGYPAIPTEMSRRV